MKLYRDNKKINKVRIIDNSKRKKIINSDKILIFASLLAMTHLCYDVSTLKKEVPYEKNISVTTVTKASETNIMTKGFAINKCVKMCYDYSYVFNVKPDIVMDVIIKNLDDVTENEFEEKRNILGTNKKYSSLEMQVIILSKRINENPSKYGYTKKDVLFDADINNTLTVREMVYKYADALSVDRNMALAIACAESGYFEEEIATVYNNPYSYRLSNEDFEKFDTLEQGIAVGVLNLKEGYIDKGLDTYEKIEYTYCPDSVNNHWLKLVKGVLENLDNGKKLYDEKKLVLKK